MKTFKLSLEFPLIGFAFDNLPRLALLSGLLVFFHGASAQQSILNPNRSYCANALPATLEIAVQNYCSSCTYKYDIGGGLQNTASMTSLPGGAGKFTTVSLGEGVYHVYSNNSSIGTFTITETQPSVSVSRTLSSTPWVCDGTEVTISASGGTSYEWRIEGQNTVLSTSSSYTVTAQEGTDVIYEVTANTTCGQATNTVFVGGLTEVSGASINSGSTARCKGSGTTQYTASASNVTNGWSWSISPSSAGSISSSGLVTWNSGFPATGASQNATITATANGNCNSTSTATRTVTVTNVLQQIVTGGGSSCSVGTSHSIGMQETTSGVTYRLYRENQSGSADIGMFIGNGSAMSFGSYSHFDTYYVIASTGSCSSEMYNRVSIGQLTPGTMTVSRNHAQTPSVCAGTVVTLSASGGANHIWYRISDGQQVGTGTSLNVTAQEGVEETYEVRANETVCNNQVTGQVFVGGLFEVKNAAISGGVNTRFQGAGTTILDASAQHAVNGYTWTISPSAAGTISYSGQGLQATVTWDPTWPGSNVSAQATVNLTAYGNCNSEAYASKTITTRKPEYIVQPNFDLCNDEAAVGRQIAIENYCSTCSYTYQTVEGGAAAPINHVDLVDIPGSPDRKLFTTAPLGPGSYNFYSDGLTFGTVTITSLTPEPIYASITRTGFSTEGSGNNLVFFVCTVGSTYSLGINKSGFTADWNWYRDGSIIPGTANQETLIPDADGVYTIQFTNVNVTAECRDHNDFSQPEGVTIDLEEAPPLNDYNHTFSECDNVRSNTITETIGTDYEIVWYNSAGTEIGTGATQNFTSLTEGTYNYTIRTRHTGSRACLGAISAVSVVITKPVVSINSPATNELLLAGETIDLDWSSIYVPGNQTIIWTLEGGPTSVSIADPDAWVIAPTQEPSNSYYVKAAVCGLEFISNIFRIGDPNPRDLINPKEGEILVQYDPQAIQWTEDSDHGFNIYYQEEGQSSVLINGNGGYTSAGGISTYDWIVQANDGSSLLGQYKIMVEEQDELWKFEAGIEIVEDLTVITPNYSTTYGLNEIMNITWSGASLNRDVTVEITGYDATETQVYSHQIFSGPNEDRYVQWVVDPTLDESLQYLIRISQEVQGTGQPVKYLEDVSDEFFLVQNCPNAGISVNHPYNYVKSFTARVPLGGCISAQNDAAKVQESVQFLDGLGRPTQSVQRQYTPDKKDLVAQAHYDAYGREVGAYLPYKSGSDLGQYQVGWDTDQPAFYGAEGAYAFTESVLEPSPLGRINSQANPGQIWSKANGQHMVDYKYETNVANEVRSLRASGDQIIDRGFYGANELTKEVVTDENTGPQEGETTTFTNKSGQVILKKTKLTDDGTTVTYGYTYYVHDDFGNLKHVVQPEGTRYILEEASYDWTNLNDDDFRKLWVFSYEYDERQRMIGKRVPGSDWMYMVYDKRNRLVLTQDGNQRDFETLTGGEEIPEYEGRSHYVKSGSVKLTPGFSMTASATESYVITTDANSVQQQWLFTKYDKINRPVATGEATLAGDREYLQGNLNAWTGPMTESLGAGSGYAHDFGGYSNTAFPNTITDGDLHTVSYYDNYNFLPTAELDTDARNNMEVKGLATGGLTRVLGTTTDLLMVTYYDVKHRVRKTHNTTLVGHDDIENGYLNSVSGLVTSTARKHVGPQGAIDIDETFSYDHMDRLLANQHTISRGGVAQPTRTISSNTYDALGRLTEKNLGGSTSPAQSVDYLYNVRGWLTHINGFANNDINDGNDQFWTTMHYYNPHNLTAGYNQYNGNIGIIFWQNHGAVNSNTLHTRYSYDAASRLTSNFYLSNTAPDYNFYRVYGIKYDANGNIERLKRTHGSTALADDLSYSYEGNRLISVTDASFNTQLFEDGNTSGNDYSYDRNGNMISDANKGITGINYNYLNLLELVAINGEEVSYTYDAAGMKYRKTYTNGDGTKVTDYVGGFHYERDVAESVSSLEFLQHAEGRVVFDGSTWDYQYNLTDHLGNVRVTVDESGNVEQADDYYPFGLTFNHYQKDPPENYYRFQGQEHQPETEWDQYKWRNADPAIGRFFNIDPLAEKYLYNSPYAFSENKVIAHFELEGLEAVTGKYNYKNLENNYESDGQSIVNSQEGLAWMRGKGMNTCAIRMSYCFNKSGHPVPSSQNTPSDVKVQNGRDEDVGNFILTATGMNNYLTNLESPTLSFENLD